jgi:hypothetical protein
MTTKLTVVTANIGRTYKPGEAGDNIERVRHGFPGAFVGWQEIDEADPDNEHGDLGRTFGPERYKNVAIRHAVPISVPKPWAVEDARVELACTFIPHATPNRYIVSALCSHPDLSEPVMFKNGHYNLPRLGGKEGPIHWRDCQNAWWTSTREDHRAGHTIITTRDTNRLRRMPKLHPTERQLLPNAISRITVIPGSVGVKVTGRRDVNLTIDGHNARGVDLLLSVKETS